MGKYCDLSQIYIDSKAVTVHTDPTLPGGLHPTCPNIYEHAAYLERKEEELALV